MRGPCPHSPSAGPEVPATWLGASGALPGPAEKPGRGAQLAAGGGHVGNGTNGRRPQEPAVSAAGAAVASCPATPAGRGGCAPPPHPLLPAAPHCSSLLLQPGMQSKGRKEQRSHRGWKSECQADGHLSQGAGVGEAERQLPCRSPAEAAGSLPLPAAFSHGEGCGFRLFPLQILNGTSGGRGNACRCLETAPRVTGPGAGGRPEGLLPETSDRGARGHPPARDTHPPSREHFPAWRRGSQMTGSPLSPGSRHSPGRGRAPARRQRVAGGSAECGRCGRQGRVQLHCGGPTPSCLPSGTHSCQGEQGPRPPLLQGRAAFVPVLSQIPRNGHPRAPFSVPKDPTEPLGH